MSGLPGSGKSTIALRLAPALGLPVIDKDVVLEELFDAKGVGNEAMRRSLSRESDRIFRDRALSTDGAILVSHWRLPGMPEDSGTPTDWLLPHMVVNVRCVCAPELAAERFHARKRHPGHRDGDRSYAEILASIRAVARLGRLEIGSSVDVDTTVEPDLQAMLRLIRREMQAWPFSVRESSVPKQP
jgi:hypothetical protein